MSVGFVPTDPIEDVRRTYRAVIELRKTLPRNVDLRVPVRLLHAFENGLARRSQQLIPADSLRRS